MAAVDTLKLDPFGSLGSHSDWLFLFTRSGRLLLSGHPAKNKPKPDENEWSHATNDTR
jgi:hypothetical protein